MRPSKSLVVTRILDRIIENAGQAEIFSKARASDVSTTEALVDIQDLAAEIDWDTERMLNALESGDSSERKSIEDQVREMDPNRILIIVSL